MLCVMHVGEGREDYTEQFLEGFLKKELCGGCFHLTRFRLKKYGGSWQTVRENLMPGYVFVATGEPEKLHKALKKTGNYRLTGSDDVYVSALKAAEEDFIKQITGSGSRKGEIGLSTIRISESGQVEVLSGPLRNVENFVQKIDLHRRVAEIEADFMGEKKRLYLGVEFEGTA